MKKYESKVYSQGGQDGVIEHIFDVIGTTNKFFVEFGAKDGVDLSNTANLRLNKGWTGLLMDSEPSDHELVKWHNVVPHNIEALLKHYNVPIDFDYLSIDIDGNDYWVWKAITNWRPRVVSIEVNTHFYPHDAFAIAYNPDHRWDGTSYFGASLAALYKLGVTRGYVLVHLVDTLDAFFVRQDSESLSLPARCPEDLLPELITCFPPDETGRPWIQV